MSIKSAPYYWVECDGCAVSAAEGGDYSAWSDKASAEIEPEAMDWLKIAETHYCEDCKGQFICEECGELKTECDCKEETK